jgi:hypothetical protein
MCESIPIKSNYCVSRKKNVFSRLIKVTFELFVEVIFIPRYSRHHCSELWWTANDLYLSTISTQNEFNALVNKYPTMTVEEAKRVLY